MRSRSRCAWYMMYMFKVYMMYMYNVYIYDVYVVTVYIILESTYTPRILLLLLLLYTHLTYIYSQYPIHTLLILLPQLDVAYICEYSRESETSRGRSRFFHGQKKILLYSGRAHFFRSVWCSVL